VRCDWWRCDWWFRCKMLRTALKHMKIGFPLVTNRVRALGSGSGLGLWARDLSLGLLILGSGVRLWAVGLGAGDVRVQPRRRPELSKHKQGKNPYS